MTLIYQNKNKEIFKYTCDFMSLEEAKTAAYHYMEKMDLLKDKYIYKSYEK